MPRRLPHPCTRLPRRLQIVMTLVALCLFFIFFLGSSDSDDFDPLLGNFPFGPQLQSSVHQAVAGAQNVIDRLPNPLGTPAHHPPPDQAESRHEEVRWYADWGWQNPFSSSITLDEERAVLPPLPQRPPIYTYFDAAGRRKDEKNRNAEQELVQIWRRAWWAKGFKPVVLSSAEASNHPLYRTMVDLKLGAEMQMELMRWLAWANMGTGIMSNWLTLPMGSFDDPLFEFLRGHQYPELVRYEGLGSALFVGSKDKIEGALREALSSPSILANSHSMVEGVPGDMFHADVQPKSIAFYSVNTIQEKYPTIKEKLDDPATRGDGLAILPVLINAHLHQTWQSQFSEGVAVLKPLPEHTTVLIAPAIEIARNLTQCPNNPLPSSCPPNRSQCRPCVSGSMSITVPRYFSNDSTLFSIVTMPHPYTTNSLVKTKERLDLKFIRRETSRDVWVLDVTDRELNSAMSARARLPLIKDAVASPYGAAHSLWLTAERAPDATQPDDMVELDWIFGFQLPRGESPGSKSPVAPNLEQPRPAEPKQTYGDDGHIPTDRDLRIEQALLTQATTALKDGSRSGSAAPARKQSDAVRLRAIVEAWNLADTEAWKFIRAFNARRRLERLRWLREEQAYFDGR